MLLIVFLRSRKLDTMADNTVAEQNTKSNDKIFSRDIFRQNATQARSF